MDLKLIYSEVYKVPKIFIDGQHSVSFVAEPSLMPRGKFKYLRVSGHVMQILKKGRMKNGERQEHQSLMNKQSDICNMGLSDVDSDLKGLPVFKKLLPYLKRAIAKHLDDNGLFPPDALPALEKDLVKINAKMVEDKQKEDEKKAKKAEKAQLKKEREQKKKEREEKRSQREMKRKKKNEQEK